LGPLRFLRISCFEIRDCGARAASARVRILAIEIVTCVPYRGYNTGGLGHFGPRTRRTHMKIAAVVMGAVLVVCLMPGDAECG
jgi:hypothetical protein